MNRLHTEPPLYAVRDSAVRLECALAGTSFGDRTRCVAGSGDAGPRVGPDQYPGRVCEIPDACSALPVRSCRSGRRTSRRWTGLAISRLLLGFLLAGKASFMAASLAVGTRYSGANRNSVSLSLWRCRWLPWAALLSQDPSSLRGCFRPFWQGLALVLAFVGNTTIVLCFYLFPDGRFVLPGSRSA